MLFFITEDLPYCEIGESGVVQLSGTAGAGSVYYAGLPHPSAPEELAAHTDQVKLARRFESDETDEVIRYLMEHLREGKTAFLEKFAERRKLLSDHRPSHYYSM